MLKRIAKLQSHKREIDLENEKTRNKEGHLVPWDQNQLTCNLDPFRFAALEMLKCTVVKKRGLVCAETTTNTLDVTHAGHEIKLCRSQIQSTSSYQGSLVESANKTITQL